MFLTVRRVGEHGEALTLWRRHSGVDTQPRLGLHRVAGEVP